MIENNTAGNVNWDELDNKQSLSNSQLSELVEMYESTMREISENEVLKGKVVGITDREVLVNVGFKSDGVVSISEFRDLPELKVGDEVDVYIEQQEDANGQIILSRKKAMAVSAWKSIDEAFKNDTIIEGVIKRRTKGGLIADVFGIEAFLPGSQIDVKPIRDFDIYVGKKMELKVVKINYANDNVVVSHKVLIEKDLEAQRQQILNNLEKGQVLEGVVKNITHFGVFVDLGGVDGLLHITDISWGRITHPSEVLELDQKVNIVVLDFDEDKKRISLGMKQLQPHPWDSLDAAIQVGSRVMGRIVNVADYGAFLEIKPGVEGLIHVSEMSWSQHLRNPQEFLQIGDEIQAEVLTIDREERKMSLGIKQLTEDPWTNTEVHQKYAANTRHKGIVRNLTNYGLFLELQEGIDGLVHISDLSWTKKIKDPKEFVKIGEELEVVVLELDIEQRRLALGHKQLEENPWDTFATIFVPNSVHQGTVVNKTDKGTSIELAYGVQGFASTKYLVREDGSKIELGETADFKVVEFSKEEQRIVLSHVATYRSGDASKGKRKKEDGSDEEFDGEEAKTSIKDVEATTSLADNDALSQLKEDMKDNNKQ
ncbi:30S ribosomal protein S1 [Hugenholtzia roseola]|uniref:30S ribosomal protein S1 n=1 Tax=Hugenholtzia roseola TaxID=1002 RepID=UPI0004798D96|nr:30S ribosomal protein S1 [Hugenholtzia roseola]